MLMSIRRRKGESSLTETRTYWLSFCDSDLPAGQRFRGVVVVDVTRAQADEALRLRPDMYDQVEGPWIGAAIRACWSAGVNPGGEVASIRVDDHPAARRFLPHYPRLRLLSAEDAARIESTDATAPPSATSPADPDRPS
jgi:hypothetical protein